MRAPLLLSTEGLNRWSASESNMSQLEMLTHHFATTNSISGIEAAAIYKIRALPRRISDLEERGWVFNRVWKKDPSGQRYKRYTVVTTP
jgi:hypothetical protein